MSDIQWDDTASSGTPAAAPKAPAAGIAWDDSAPSASAVPTLKRPGYRLSDAPKELAAGALEGTGAAISGIGSFGQMAARPIVAGINALAGKPVLSRPVNAFRGAGDAITDLGKRLSSTESEAAQTANAQPLVQGSLLHPSTLRLGEGAGNPKAWLQSGANLVGQAIPMLAGGLESKGLRLAPELAAKVAAKETLTAGETAAVAAAERAVARRTLATGAAIGGVQGAQGSSDAERSRIEAMTPDQLSVIPAYQQMIARGMSADAAKAELADAASQNAYAAALPVATAAGVLGATPFLRSAQEKLAAAAGPSLLRRIGAGAAIEAPAQGAIGVAQQAAQTAAANATTGEARPLGENSAAAFGGGAVAGGVFGAAGGLLHHPAVPHPDAAPGSLSDAANAITQPASGPIGRAAEAAAATTRPAEAAPAPAEQAAPSPTPAAAAALPIDAGVPPWVDTSTGQVSTPTKGALTAELAKHLITTYDTQGHMRVNAGNLADAWGVTKADINRARSAATQIASKTIRTRDAAVADAVGTDSTDAPASEPANTSATQGGSSTASMPFMVTKAQKQGLRDLGHSDADIAKMTPQKAHDLLAEGKSVQADAFPEDNAKINALASDQPAPEAGHGNDSTSSAADAPAKQADTAPAGKADAAAAADGTAGPTDTSVKPADAVPADVAGAGDAADAKPALKGDPADTPATKADTAASEPIAAEPVKPEPAAKPSAETTATTGPASPEVKPARATAAARDAEGMRVKTADGETNGRVHVDNLVRDGYTKVNSTRAGDRMVHTLVNADGESRPIKARQLKYAQEATARVASPAVKESLTAGQKRTAELLGATVGDTVRTTGMGKEIQPGSVWKIDRIERDGTVHTSSPGGGTATWKRSELEREVRAGAAFEKAPAKAASDATATPIDAAAHEAATSPHNDIPEPTQPQIEAGNYKKGHIDVHGMDISIENPRGSTRSGVGDGGKAWSHVMSDHYGYVRGTVGADGEHVDAYVGAHSESKRVFVVDQIDQKTGKFDEHKAMIGFKTKRDAIQAYKSNFDKGWKVGPVHDMTVDGFKAWLKQGDTTKPISDQSENGKKSLKVAEPTASKKKPEASALFRMEDDKTREPFYSALTRSVDSAKGAPKSADAATWKQWMDGAQRRGEFKQAEREWLGVDQWLADQHGKVSREALQQYVRDNQVQVKETDLGKPREQSFNDQMDFAHSMREKYGDGWADKATPQEMQEYHAFRNRTDSQNGGTKFSSYQMPGGDNYRELLLTLPITDAQQKAHAQAIEAYDAVEKSLRDARIAVTAMRDQVSTENAKRMEAYGKQVDQWTEAAKSHIYGAYEAEIDRVAKSKFPGEQGARSFAEPIVQRSGYFEKVRDDYVRDHPKPKKPELKQEDSDLVNRARQAMNDYESAKSPTPQGYQSGHFDQPNILTHVRFNERTDADGKKVLFLEEVQSDWHQDGRKHGYDDNSGFASPSDSPGLAVPDAPFKKEWPMLAMKRMVRYAAENGFDRIGWTTGEQQAARYDLSKQVDSIEVKPYGGYRSVTIDHHAGSIPLDVNNDGKVTGGKSDLIGKNLDEVIGKEMAEKIMAQKERTTISGAGLKLGGEGMQAFYDRMLPNEVNKWAKPFGAKVGDIYLDPKNPLTRSVSNDGPQEMAGLGGAPVHSLDITPAMREAALGGLPLFRKSEGHAETSADRATPAQEAHATRIRTIADAAMSKWKGDDVPNLRVVATPEQLPDYAKRGPDGNPSPDYKRAAGMYDGRTIYIVASAHDGGRDGMRKILTTLAHEGVGHYGMDRIVSRELGADAWSKIETWVERLRHDKALGSKAMRDVLDTVERRYSANDGTPADATTFARETMAIMAERGIHNGLLDRVITAVRKFIRRVLPDLKLSEAELRQLLVHSDEYLRRGERYDQRVAAKQAMAFSQDRTDTASPAFRRFFGDSKVVDKHGEPLPVYHGTAEDFTAFDPNRSGSATAHMTSTLGTFFAEDRGKAEHYARNASQGVPAEERIVDAYLSIQKPYEMGLKQFMGIDSKAESTALRKKLTAEGYDGIHLKDVGQWVAFEPGQIKSASDNRGTFDKANPNIYFSRDGWSEDFPDAVVGHKLGVVRDHPDYAAAKAGDPAAALRLARDVVTPDYVKSIRDALPDGSKPIIVPVVARESAGDNEIPRMAAEVLAKQLGTTADTEITQQDKVSRGGSDTMHRLANQPAFTGKVEPGRDYVLLDDTLTQGGTLAQLKTHIEREGGKVVLATALTGKDYSRKLALDPDTLRKMRGRFGSIESWWKQQFGHGFDGLTESEARAALTFDRGHLSPDGLRNRVAAGKVPEIGRMGEGAAGDRPGAEAPGAAGRLKPDFSVDDRGERIEPGATAKPFSRASASIEAIHDQLPKLDRTAFQAVKDWIGGKARDLEPHALGALQLRHVLELAGEVKVLERPAKAYAELYQRMDGDRNKLTQDGVTKVDALTRWARETGAAGWAGKIKPEARKLFKFMHAVTQLAIDPTSQYERLMVRDSRGEQMPWTKELIKERIDALRGQMRGRPGDDKTAMMDEIKDLQKIPARERARAEKYPELVAAWNALTPEARQHFVTMRDHYREQSEALEQATVDHINSLDVPAQNKRAAVDLVRKNFEDAKVGGVYFPLMRFGDFWISANKADGEYVFAKYETAAEQAQAEKQLLASGATIEATGRQDNNYRAKNAPSGTFIGDLMGLLKAGNAPERVQDAIYQMYLKTLPELSLRKRGIHRKNVAGYTDDVPRAFASSVFHGAHQLSKARYGWQLQNTMEHMQGVVEGSRTGNMMNAGESAHVDALMGELSRRHDWVLNPTNSKLATAITSIGFGYFLGASPASALVNLIQVPQIVLPVLGAQHGWGKATAVLGRTMRDAFRTAGNIDKVLQGEDLRAFKALQEQGTFQRTATHSLAGVAEGDSLRSSPAYTRVMNAVSWMFHKSEVINREGTGIAAFRLARARGDSFDQAVKYADQITNGTHGDYSNANRARIMQGNTAKVLLQFKNYSLSMSWLWGREFYKAFKGESPEVRAVARRTLTGLLGMTGLFAGVVGMPIFNALRYGSQAVHAVTGNDDEPWDFDTEFRSWLAEHLGETAANVIADGPVSQLGANVSSRVSMSDLWFRDADRQLEGEAAYNNMLQSIAGPIGGMLKNMYVGSQQFNEGHTWRGIETMLPTAAKNAMKAVRFAHEGVNTLRGDPIVPDVSAPDQLIQAMGFQPTKIAQQQRINNALFTYSQFVQDRRSALMNAFALSQHAGDTDGRSEALAKIQAFNARYPEIAIRMSNLQASLRQRARFSAQAHNGIVINNKIANRIRQEVGPAAGG